MVSLFLSVVLMASPASACSGGKCSVKAVTRTKTVEKVRVSHRHRCHVRRVRGCR